MGGDNAPGEIVKGALEGAKNENVSLIFTGDKEKIESLIAEYAPGSDHTVIGTEEVVSMDDDPMCVVKSKKDSSLGTALTLLRDGEGDALISAGSTGALLIGSSLIVRRIKGVKRAVIAATLPFGENGTLLIDSGAATTATAEEMEQYGLMGSIYFKSVMGVLSPRVGLLNNGAESTKGSEEYVKANHLLEKNDQINFVGNIEGCDIPFGRCDVLVCDGFAGNIALKTLEGLGKYLMKTIKEEIQSGSVTEKLGGALVKKTMQSLKKRMDSSEYGGAPILGVSAPVIKAHGSSDARAFANAVRQARAFVESGACLKIGEARKA